MTGDRQFEFKRSSRPVHQPSVRVGLSGPFSLHLEEPDANQPSLDSMPGRPKRQVVRPREPQDREKSPTEDFSPSPLAEGSARATDESLQGNSGKLEPLERLLGDWDVGSPNQPEKPFRVIFEWKGNRSCMVYRSLQRQATAWVLLGTGMIYWDPATRAIRETTFEESTHLFQNGTWSPQQDRLVGEFVNYGEGGTRRKARYVIRFVDRDTMNMSSALEYEFKRSRRGMGPPGEREGSTSRFTPRAGEARVQR